MNEATLVTQQMIDDTRGWLADGWRDYSVAGKLAKKYGMKSRVEAISVVHRIGDDLEAKGRAVSRSFQ